MISGPQNIQNLMLFDSHHQVRKEYLKKTSPIKAFLCLLFAAVFLMGCVPKKETYLYPFPKQIKSKKGFARIKGVIKDIRERNETVENDPEWIKGAYESLKIENLMDIPEEDFAQYAEYVRGGRAFIIVHPAFYTFFTPDSRMRLKDLGEAHKDNLVERLYAKRHLYDVSLIVMQEQEKAQRDFMEVLSMEKLLVILVVPKGYKSHMNTARTYGRDEYTRFINEISNESDSLVYVESKQWNKGDLEGHTMGKLLDFLVQVDVKRVYVGGGYIGRCLGAFYDSANKYMKKHGQDKYFKFYMVPELAAVSPADLRGEWLDGLYSEAGINYSKASKNLQRFKAYGVQHEIPRVKRFYIYEFTFEKEKE